MFDSQHLADAIHAYDNHLTGHLAVLLAQHEWHDVFEPAVLAARKVVYTKDGSGANAVADMYGHFGHLVDETTYGY